MPILQKIAKAATQYQAAKERRDVSRATRAKIKAEREVGVAQAKAKASKAKLELERIEAQRAAARAKKGRGKLGTGIVGAAKFVGAVGKYIGETKAAKSAYNAPAKPRPKTVKKKKKATTAKYVTIKGKRYRLEPTKR